ncbi:MAG: quinoprotein dehydrogenase-associated SoxYZ-like carrier [Proteobacteria bacterium]|nr:quinoprotein dehydrogenase-associated SoxYZ-like carrier [Pseudomonadota bacterium]
MLFLVVANVQSSERPGGLLTENAPIDDPLGSSAWNIMYNVHIPGARVVFDDRVIVMAPTSAENPMSVPVMVDASALSDVDKIILVADFNPISKILEFYPTRTLAKLGFRFKIQQATPVRALVHTSDGLWHMNGAWIDASGGGCTAPSMASGNADWASRVGQISGKNWLRGHNMSRLKFQINHPMDTGLADGIPAFYLEQLVIVDQDGAELGTIKPFEPISEDPVFTLDVHATGSMSLWGRDNNGNIFEAPLFPRS